MPVNPYTPGAAKRPAAFAGRTRQFALITDLADQLETGYPAEDYVFTGLRGMGKTVFLQEVKDRLVARGWLCGYYEVRRNDDPGAAVGHIIADLVNEFSGAGWFKRAIKATTARLGPAKLTVSANDMTAGLELAMNQKTTDDYRELLSLLTKLGEAARKEGVGFALLIDELQVFYLRAIATLLQVSRRLEGLPVTIVGAGLPTLPAIVSKAGSYAERFSFEKIDKLSRRESQDAVVSPAATFGVTYAGPALQEILDRARDFPFFLQLYACETWRAAGTPSDKRGFVITRAHVTAALPEVQRRADIGLYKARYDRASAKEQAYLQAMASLGDEDISSGATAKSLGKNAQAAGVIRDRLVKKGLIHSERTGRLDFSVPGFGEYVRRRAALDVPG